MKLGFIGLGIMGTPMAINLARAGHQLHVTTIGPVADELLSLGAVSVETARQVTEASDIIFIMVPDTPQVEEVLFGENGCTKASLKGKTIVDMSSISPIETKRFARQVNELGGDYLDAPVSGDLQAGAWLGLLIFGTCSFVHCSDSNTGLFCLSKERRLPRPEIRFSNYLKLAIPSAGTLRS